MLMDSRGTGGRNRITTCPSDVGAGVNGAASSVGSISVLSSALQGSRRGPSAPFLPGNCGAGVHECERHQRKSSRLPDHHYQNSPKHDRSTLPTVQGDSFASCSPLRASLSVSFVPLCHDSFLRLRHPPTQRVLLALCAYEGDQADGVIPSPQCLPRSPAEVAVGALLWRFFGHPSPHSRLPAQDPNIQDWPDWFRAGDPIR
jgi:hypothetical protein